MNWDLAIRRNTSGLMQIVSIILGLLNGLSPDAPQLQRAIKSRICVLLRPAEAALRRLILIVQFHLKIEASVSKQKAEPSKLSAAEKARLAQLERTFPFELFDRMKDFSQNIQRPRCLPRISVPGFINPVFAPPNETGAGDLVDCPSLLKRIEAVQTALSDLPKQARRMARKIARLKTSQKPKRINPMRPGYPPGHKIRPRHDVDYLLDECHALAIHMENCRWQSVNARDPTA